MAAKTMALENICSNCPALRGIRAQEEWAAAKISCEADRTSYLSGYESKKQALNIAAAEIACSDQVKVLPEDETQVPPLGGGWHEFASHCPAYQTISK